MVRGVNKSVIEISETGNDCFERAILFVRPGSEREDGDHLRRRAGEYLMGLRLRPRFYKNAGFFAASLKFLGAAAAGAGLAVLVLLKII